MRKQGQKGLEGVEKTGWRTRRRKGAAENTEERLKLNAFPGYKSIFKIITVTKTFVVVVVTVL